MPEAPWFSFLINIFCSGPWGKTDNWTIAPVICLEVGIRKVFSPTRLMLVEYPWDSYRQGLDKTYNQVRHFKPPLICTVEKIMTGTCTHTLRHLRTSTNTHTRIPECQIKSRASPSAPCEGSPQMNPSGGSLRNPGLSSLRAPDSVLKKC